MAITQHARARWRHCIDSAKFGTLKKRMTFCFYWVQRKPKRKKRQNVVKFFPVLSLWYCLSFGQVIYKYICRQAKLQRGPNIATFVRLLFLQICALICGVLFFKPCFTFRKPHVNLPCHLFVYAAGFIKLCSGSGNASITYNGVCAYDGRSLFSQGTNTS